MRFLLLIFFIPFSSIAQGLGGLWAGSLFNDSTGMNNRYEIIISEKKGQFRAYSLTTFVIENREYTGMKSVKVSYYNGKYFFEDIALVSHNYPVAPPKGIKQLTVVTLETTGQVQVLTGKFTTTLTRQYGKPVTGTLRLEKQQNISPSALVPLLQEKGLAGGFLSEQNKTDTVGATSKNTDPLSKKTARSAVALVSGNPIQPEGKDLVKELAKRKVETIETIYFTSDSLLLTLYDNGYVDGDSVSIIVNGSVLIQHQLLSTEAVSKVIRTPQGKTDSLSIVMYAENLGSIAPNSGLLIIKDGSKRHEITFTGDLQKNAAVVLKRRK